MATAIMVLIALLAGPPQSLVEDGFAVISHILVTASGDPAKLPEAGVVAPYIALEGTDSQGNAAVFYLLRMISADPSPPLGSLCTFEVVRGPLLPGRYVETFDGAAVPADGEPVLILGHFDCRITSDSPVFD